MVVDRDGEGALGGVLADDVLAQEVEDLARLRQLLEAEIDRVGQLFLDDFVAQLELTPDALDAVAEQAMSRGTGARGLRAILEEVLLPVMFDVPSEDDIDKVVITREVVLDRITPTIVRRRAA